MPDPKPDDIEGLFLTGSTQEGFGLDACTLDDPFLMLNKEKVLEEIKFKGAISDLYVVKEQIEKYKGDTIMLHLDDDEVYGQNFFIVLTPETAANFQKLQDERIAQAMAAAPKGGGGGGEDGDDYVEEEYVPPVSKPWVSQGSEAEIAEESVVYTRDRYVLTMVRRRKEFCAPYKFSDRDAQEDPNIQQNDCRPYKDPNFETKRKEHSIGVQAVPEASDAKCQTTWFRPVNKTIQYAPVTMTQRQKFDQLDSSEMRTFLQTIRERYEEALQQNETVDIFSDDFAELAAEEETSLDSGQTELKELQSYYHLDYCANRVLTFIQWQPNAKGVVAVSGAKRMTFEERLQIAGTVQTGYILLWNAIDPINPQYVLEAPGDVHCFRFCPTDSDVVVGGLESGQVAVWDLKEARAKARDAKLLADDDDKEGNSSGSTITATAKVLSAVDQSHRRAIVDLNWLPPTLEVTEKGKFLRPKEDAPPPDPSAPFTQFFSIAADGQLLFWDMRKAEESLLPPEEKPKDDTGKNKKEGWGPTAKMPLANPDGAMELAPVYFLDVPLEDFTGECSIYSVTEEGEFFKVELAKPAADNFSKGVGWIPKGESSRKPYVLPGHYGPCVALQRSPFVAQVHLSVGDWTFNIWKEGVDMPLFTSPFCSCMYSCGAWSPSRAAVLFIGRTDGLMDIWDLLDRSHEPSMTIPVSPTSITSMEFLIKGNSQLLAVGDDQGTVHVLEVPRNLRRAANEKAFAQNFFVREQRVEYIQRAAESGNAESGDGKETARRRQSPRRENRRRRRSLRWSSRLLRRCSWKRWG